MINSFLFLCLFWYFLALQACDRGSATFAEKAEAVHSAGGVGMVLMNVPGGRTDVGVRDLVLPTMHVPVQFRSTLIDYARSVTANPTATLQFGGLSYDIFAPLMSDFSSRGPAQLANGVILKPDMTAPGKVAQSLSESPI